MGAGSQSDSARSISECSNASVLDLTDIHWVIVGGESGPGAGPMDPAWAEDLRDQCLRAAVPFFFKQWGGRNKKRAGRLLAGRCWDEMPVAGAGIETGSKQGDNWGR